MRGMKPKAFLIMGKSFRHLLPGKEKENWLHMTRPPALMCKKQTTVRDEKSQQIRVFLVFFVFFVFSAFNRQTKQWQWQIVMALPLAAATMAQKQHQTLWRGTLGSRISDPAANNVTNDVWRVADAAQEILKMKEQKIQPHNCHGPRWAKGRGFATLRIRSVSAGFGHFSWLAQRGGDDDDYKSWQILDAG